MIVSYAQNFEDVRLWRALGHIERGCYVDVGAQDPVVDSVSRAFYDKGWRGVHVEPSAGYAARLTEDRPDERVIQAVVANTPGLVAFFEFPGTGLSTADRAIAERHAQAGHRMREVTVPTVSLAAVLESPGNRDIHWLKIDVEGFEYEVLRSWGKSGVRPWVLVVESTAPMTQVETHERWESLVLKRGYRFACFDGLNRYYVAASHGELAGPLAVAPNVFDGFSLSGTASSSYAAVLNGRLRELESAAVSASEASKAREDELLAVRGKYSDETTRLVRELETNARAFSEQALAFERARANLAEEQAARERQIGDQLAAGEREMAERERAHVGQLSELQREMSRLQVASEHALSERERAHAEQLSERHRETIRLQAVISAQSNAFAQQSAVERREFELRLSDQLHLAHAEVTSLVQDGARREERHAAELQAFREAARKSHETLRGRIGRLRGLALHQANLLRLVFASRSWRVTAPLRTILQLMQRALGQGSHGSIEQEQPSVPLIEEIANADGSPGLLPVFPQRGLLSAIAHAMAIRGCRLDTPGDLPDPPAT